VAGRKLAARIVPSLLVRTAFVRSGWRESRSANNRSQHDGSSDMTAGYRTTAAAIASRPLKY
jgi:hypothetical protein